MNDSKSVTYRTSDDPIVRFCFFYLLLYLGSLILGGIGVFEIIFGLMIIFTRILVRIPYFRPFIRRFLGFKAPEQMAHNPPSRILSIISIAFNLIVVGFYATVSILLIRLGTEQLLENGFLNQNLIYMFFFK